MDKADCGKTILVAALLGGCHTGQQVVSPPETRMEMLEETLHGVAVADPYRWLEDESSPETESWVRKQSAYSRSVLDALPGRARMRQRLTEVLGTGSVTRPEEAAGRYFYSKKQGHQNQPVLYVRKGIDGKDRVLIDPNEMGTDGTVTVDWFFPSKDGRLLTYGMSSGGTETSDLHILEVDSGASVGKPIPKVRWANPQWLKDGSGFYYGRPRKLEGIGPGEEVYDRRIFYHELGTKWSEDKLIYDERLKKEEIPDAILSPDERYLLIDVFMGWGKNRLYVKDLRRNRLITIADDGESSYTGEIVGETLFVLTNADAPRYRVFKVNLRTPDRKHWKEIIAQSDAVIDFMKVVGGKLFVGYLRDAHLELDIFGLDGQREGEVVLPELGTVSDFDGKSDGEEAFFEFSSFTTPPTVYRLDLTVGPGNPESVQVWSRLDAPIDPSQFESRQVFYRSKDGTRIPMFIIRKKGVGEDARAPGLLYGYGGFNIALTPNFRASFFPWLESGGVLAIANLRGGSEYGEEWHRAGMLDKKQNVFDDFIAAAEYLVEQRYVDPKRLAIHGRSNGGLLVGAAMTQRPDLFRAVICGVPLLDMVRYHRFRMARLWISEYGSAENLDDFQWLHAYSPYHRVRDGESYPATLIYTGASDSRVDPLHARKMAARLQAANASKHPIVLRVETGAGHGLGKPLSKTVEEWTDIWSFTFDQLGVEYE